MRIVGQIGLAAITIFLVAGCPGKGDPFAPMKPIDVVEISKNTSEFQREILADGSVTFAEYERATLATIACLENGGIPQLKIDGPRPRGGDARFLTFDITQSGSMTAEEGEKFRERLEPLTARCYRDYYTDVTRVWEYQNLLKPEQRERLKPQVVDCLAAAGLKLDREASYEDIFKAVSENTDNAAVRDCHRKFSEFFVVGVE